MKTGELYYNLIFSTGLLFAFFIISFLLKLFFERRELDSNFKSKRSRQLVLFIRYTGFGIIFLVILAIWKIEAKEVWIFVTSVLGFFGIALFAGWSLLSNVVGAYILFFASELDVGDTITLLDSSNSVSGKILEISLFFTRLEQADGSVVNIPNNIILQRSFIMCEQRVKDESHP